MSATITHQHQQPQIKDAAAARKRRRRAPAGGAADDCFACSRKSVKCDRKRPYCSQCLEVGLDCSGYKTQLTWGVGVASRGKLRGLSLPIAKSAPVSGGSGPPRKSLQRTRSTSSALPTQWAGPDAASGDGGCVEPGVPSPKRHRASPPVDAPAPYYGYDYLSVPQSDGASPVSIQAPWSDVPMSNMMALEDPSYRKLGAHAGSLSITSEPRLSPPLDSTSDGYLSPMSHTFSHGEDIPYVHSPGIMYDSCTNQDSPIARSPLPIVMVDQRPPTSCPSLVYAASDQSSSYASHLDFEAHLSQNLMRECDSLGVPELDTYSTSCGSSTGAPAWSPTDDDYASHQSDQNSAQWPSVYEPCTVHVNSELIAKMPFFMDYYKTIMAPSMVFIDGPHNPYRDHILRLAVGSQSLQHAICALSACNLRMKRKLSLGQGTKEMAEKLMAEKAIGDDLADGAMDDQSLTEEYHHRNLAVYLLNQQLHDPAKATHDSVLATILLLCHYRMAESGIAKFHTQFAGVKKILAMRQSQHVAPSGETGWMEAIFTYFDSISASINDRETHLESGGGGDPPLLPPGAENIVGCERGLFRTISKLARLNLISQHRPVKTRHTGQTQGAGCFPRSNGTGDLDGLDMNGQDALSNHARSQSPFSLPLGHTYKGSVADMQSQELLDMYNMPSRRFDGNGFMGTLGDDEVLASVVSSSATFDDHRANFWQEWKEVRQALQNWEFDAMRLKSTLLCDPTPSQLRDLGCLSEAFRYAALLYTERLAAPNAPSGSANFQNLVSQVVYYATSLDVGSPAEKFLLWPLFVSGSECVNELQQNIVRSKCRDIMGRSGYMNNLAALDILEGLWSGHGGKRRGGVNVGPVKVGPFNWTRCMGGVGGDEVEWIMF